MKRKLKVGVEFDCSEKPGEDSMCFLCAEKCDAFFELKENAILEFQKKMDELRELLMKLKDSGVIVSVEESESYYCLTCNEKECRICRETPPFRHLMKPYVKVLLRRV